MSSRKYLIMAVLICVALSCVLVGALYKIRALEDTVESLQSPSGKKPVELKSAGSHSRVPEDEHPAHANVERTGSEPAAAATVTGSYQILKELDADPASDPRTYAERLQQLLADNPSDEKVAIACRFIFDKAADTQGLPDYALQAIYADQSNTDLKRVIAQVLSQRGNDALLNDRIAEAQATLRSGDPKTRLDALNQLARIHSVHAVDAIAPSLQDSDSTVRLAALFALRDSGNQRHVSLVEPLTHDPDPSVSALAENVVSTLRNLSTSARTSYSRADIQAELPPIASP